MGKSAEHKAKVNAARAAAAAELNKKNYLTEAAEAKRWITNLPSFKSMGNDAVRNLQAAQARGGVTGGHARMERMQLDQNLADQAAGYNMQVGNQLASLAGQKFDVASGADATKYGVMGNLFGKMWGDADAEKAARQNAMSGFLSNIGELGVDVALGFATGGATAPASLAKWYTKFKTPPGAPSGSTGVGLGGPFASR